MIVIMVPVTTGGKSRIKRLKKWVLLKNVKITGYDDGTVNGGHTMLGPDQ